MKPGNRMGLGGPQGFALVVAAGLLALAGVVAQGIQSIVLTEAYAASLEAAEMQADYIAESGLAMTFAYLAELSRQEPDFDRALDPFLDTSCNYTANSGQLNITAGAADDHAPLLPGGVLSSDPGNSFTKVSFGGGAFYVRVDDNSDDGHEGWRCNTASCAGAPPAYLNNSDPIPLWEYRNNYFPDSTNNRESACTASAILNRPGSPPCWPGDPAANLCPEAASEEINRFRDNPVRDRDKTVIVTVVGMYPGDDWSNARGRRSYRLLVGPSRQPPAIAAQLAVTLGNGDRMCGTVGGIHSNTTIAAAGCQCGDITSTGAITGAASCSVPAACATCVPSIPEPNGAPLSIPPLVVTAPALTMAPQVSIWDSRFMNQFQWDPTLAAQQCYFYMGQDGTAYFWDFLRLPDAAGRRCDQFTGNKTPVPCGTTDATQAYSPVSEPFCHCWVPIYKSQSDGATVANPYRPPGAIFGAVTAATPGNGPPFGYSGSRADPLPLLGAPPLAAPLTTAYQGGGAPSPFCGASDCVDSAFTAGACHHGVNGGVPQGPCVEATDATVGIVAEQRMDAVWSGGGKAWYPTSSQWEAAAGIGLGAHLYDYGVLCGLGAPPPAGGLFRWDAVNNWTMPAVVIAGDNPFTPAVNEQNIPQGVYFFEGAANQTLNISAGMGTSARPVSLSVVTPMQVDVARGVFLRAPGFAPNYVMVTSSASNTLPASRSCRLQSVAANRSSLKGGILCAGSVEVQSSANITGYIVSTNGSVTIGTNVVVDMNPSLESWMSVPVRPWVWAEGVF